MERNGLAISLTKTNVVSWHKIAIQNVKNENSLAIFNEIISPITKSNFIELFYIELKSYAVNLHVLVHESHESAVLELIRNKCKRLIPDHFFIISRNIEQTFLEDQFFHQGNCFYFWRELSKLILTIFSKEKYNENSLLLIAYQVHLVWIVRCSHFKKESLQLTLLKGYVYLPTSTGPFQDIRLQEIYQSNKTILDEIFTIISKIVVNSKIQDNSWLSIWDEICLAYCVKNAKTLSKCKTNNEIITYLIPDYLNKQLGITKHLKLMLIFFLNKSKDDKI